MNDTISNEARLELRLKQTNKYMTLGLLAILAVCVLLFMYIGSVKQSEDVAKTNQKVQADLTISSDACKVYPDQELCVLARKIAANPNEALVPKDGEKGDKGDPGQNGRGVASFDIREGSLVVLYSDGQSETIGKVIGKDGANGIDGKDGRGILSSAIENGSLIVRYSDGSAQNLGIVVGPAGLNGTNGTNGKDGETVVGPQGPEGPAGKDGISVIDLKVDNTGTVVVYYSNNTSAIAGKVIVNTITSMKCDQSTNVLTITVADGTAFSATVDCSPDNLPVPKLIP